MLSQLQNLYHIPVLYNIIEYSNYIPYSNVNKYYLFCDISRCLRVFGVCMCVLYSFVLAYRLVRLSSLIIESFFVLRYICTLGVCAAPLSFYFRMMATAITVQKLTLMAQRPVVGGSGNNVERAYTVWWWREWDKVCVREGVGREVSVFTIGGTFGVLFMKNMC